MLPSIRQKPLLLNLNRHKRKSRSRPRSLRLRNLLSNHCNHKKFRSRLRNLSNLCHHRSPNNR